MLAAQTRRGVGLLPLSTVDAGAEAVAAHLRRISGRGSGVHHVIADAVRDEDLDTIAAGTASDALAAGGSAYGAAFAVATHDRAGTRPSADAKRSTIPRGPAAILAGSLSRATREQVRAFDRAKLTLGVDDFLGGDVAERRSREFAARHFASGPVLITTDHSAGGAGPGAARRSPSELSRRIELAMGDTGLMLERLGARRLIVAGGETSGAVAEALELRSAGVGPDISVGVPWIVAEDRELAIAFKSGNFGGPTFFRDALELRSP